MHELAMHTAMHTALLIIVHTVLSILACTLHVAHSLRETPISPGTSVASYKRPVQAVA